MFDRLIEALGTISTKDDKVQVKRAETQLATAILLYSVVPADRIIMPEELKALQAGLAHIFGFSEEKCLKLMSRAVNQYLREPTLLAPATLLKHRLSQSFRVLVLKTARRIAMADGTLHDFEVDVLTRMELLLGLGAPREERQSA